MRRQNLNLPIVAGYLICTKKLHLHILSLLLSIFHIVKGCLNSRHFYLIVDYLLLYVMPIMTEVIFFRYKRYIIDYRLISMVADKYFLIRIERNYTKNILVITIIQIRLGTYPVKQVSNFLVICPIFSLGKSPIRIIINLKPISLDSFKSNIDFFF